jgi:hypothetical protein
MSTINITPDQTAALLRGYGSIMNPAPTPAPAAQPLIAKPDAPSTPNFPGVNVPTQNPAVAGLQQQRQQMISSGAGVDQIKNPILHGIAKVGDVIGGMVAPGLMAAIPGTEAHHGLVLNQNANEIGLDQKQDQQTAETGLKQSQANMEQADAGKENADTYLLQHPQPKPAPTQPPHILQTDQGYFSYDPATKTTEPISFNNQPLKPFVKPTAASHTPFDEYMANPGSYIGFQKALEETKAQVAAEHPQLAKNAGVMQLYAAQKFLNEAYTRNPKLLPVIAPMIGKILGLSPEDIAVLGQVPTDQPLSPTTGDPIGTSMPGAPTGSTRTQAQTADRVLTEIPNIRKGISAISNELGPEMGRWNEFMTGSYGAGDPRFENLRANMQFLNSAAAKFHLNSVEAVKEFNQLASAGKMTPGVLNAYIDAVSNWANTARNQELGAGEKQPKSGTPDTETRTYQGHTYKKGPNGWQLQ